jgi:hypothetical protein
VARVRTQGRTSCLSVRWRDWKGLEAALNLGASLHGLSDVLDRCGRRWRSMSSVYVCVCVYVPGGVGLALV